MANIHEHFSSIIQLASQAKHELAQPIADADELFDLLDLIESDVQKARKLIEQEADLAP